MFSNNLLAGVSGQGGAYSIEDSLRFNDNDSAYLSRTPASAGDRRTWTWSGWVKRGNIGTRQIPLGANDGTKGHSFEINASDKFYFYQTGTGAPTQIVSSAVLRDVSGWYHIILVADTTQATAADRIKFYVNGVQLTAFDTAIYPLQNADLEINNNIAHNLGNRPAQSFYFDGYMAEVNFIDGQALTADDFGEINEDTGEWSPKAYSGTYGTNGFYLPFNGNANDSSGNGNNWTENNLASTDYMIDTPTNNFCTLNSIATGSYVTLSEGNLKITGNTATDSGAALPTIFVNEGLFYWETYVVNVGSGFSYAGFVQTNAPAIGTNNAELMGSLYGGLVRRNGEIYGANRTITTTDTYTAGDIIGIALDMTNGAVYASKNNTWLNGGVPTSGASKTGAIWSWTPSSMLYANGPLGAAYNGEATVLNTGADSSFAGLKTRQGNTDANGIGDFYYTPPTGYLALCTDNLPEPTIVDSESHFNVVTYTGNGGTQSITGVGFQPDFVWAKLRTTSSYHRLHDVVRGSDNTLASNVVDAEVAGNGIVSFDSDGFTMDSGTNINQPYPYVAWCWKAGGTAVTNTDGTITSQVSANVDAGFSIVGYTGTGAAGTVGHGLNSAPDMIITKERYKIEHWPVYHSGLTPNPETKQLLLYTTGAVQGSSCWNSIPPASSVFSIGSNTTNNESGQAYITYCFHSVEGFSKFGSYVGNGSADGPFVYTGFKPAFVLIKCTDTNANGHWIMKDNLRAADYNPSSGNLYANLNYAEDTTASLNVDLLANGFKIKGNYAGTNASGANFIYMAFAEHPFNYSTGR